MDNTKYWSFEYSFIKYTTSIIRGANVEWNNVFRVPYLLYKSGQTRNVDKIYGKWLAYTLHAFL